MFNWLFTSSKNKSISPETNEYLDRSIDKILNRMKPDVPIVKYKQKCVFGDRCDSCNRKNYIDKLYKNVMEDNSTETIFTKIAEYDKKYTNKV